MKNLYIVGASGCGREVLNIIKDIHAIRGVQWNIVGFLDDDLQALDSIDCDYQVVGTIKDYLPQANDVLALGIASPQIKEKIEKRGPGRCKLGMLFQFLKQSSGLRY